MSGPRYAHILPIMVLVVTVAAPFGAFAQDPNTGATTSTRVVSKKRPRTRVVVERRSFLGVGWHNSPLPGPFFPWW